MQVVDTKVWPLQAPGSDLGTVGSTAGQGEWSEGGSRRLY